MHMTNAHSIKNVPQFFRCSAFTKWNWLTIYIFGMGTREINIQENCSIILRFYFVCTQQMEQKLRKKTELRTKRGEMQQIITHRIIEFVIIKCLFATSQKRIVDNKKSKYA